MDHKYKISLDTYISVAVWFCNRRLIVIFASLKTTSTGFKFLRGRRIS